MELRTGEHNEETPNRVATDAGAATASTPSVSELLAIVERETANRWRRFAIRGILAYFSLCCLWSLLTVIYRFPHSLGPDFVQLSMWVSIPIGFTAWATKRQKAAILQLAQIDDIRAVGPLLDATGYVSLKVN